MADEIETLRQRLKVLQQHRAALLRAEVGALLHNLGKMSQEFLDGQRTCNRLSFRYVAGVLSSLVKEENYRMISKRKRIRDILTQPAVREATRILSEPDRTWLTTRDITFPEPLDGETYALGDWIEFQDASWYPPSNRMEELQEVFPRGARAVELLEACHHAGSRGEKEAEIETGASQAGDKKKGLEPQKQSPMRVASVFGYESEIQEETLKEDRNKWLAALRCWDKAVKRSAWNFTRRRELLDLGEILLARTVADTERPINEITLWDFSWTVAALYKAALVKVILEGWSPSWHPRENLEWRFLRVGVDGPGFWGRAARMTDLRSRQIALDRALDRVRELLESDMPVANEVYRDEYGRVFAVPHLMGNGDDTIRSLLEGPIRKAFSQGEEDGIGAEVVPDIQLSPRDPDRDRWALQLGQVTKGQPAPGSDPATIAKSWSNTTEDLCPVCQLRPKGPGEKAIERKVCNVCEQRREEWAKQWAEDRSGTIWVDEVADADGRVALIVGRFGLREWYGPDPEHTLIHTLIQDPDSGARKTVSFARLRRLWDTTQKFWQRAVELPEIDRPGDLVLPAAYGLRLVIQGKLSDSLGAHHAYELALGRVRLPVLYLGDGEFLTTANLQYVAGFLGEAEGDWQEPQCAAVKVKDEFLRLSGAVEIWEESGYGTIPEKRGVLRVTSVKEDNTRFRPAIVILAQPETFMALVPANRAFQLVRAIKGAYEREMGRVQDRLPVTLGMIVAQRRTPMAALLDAGRRMLRDTEESMPAEDWIVQELAEAPESKRVVISRNGVELVVGVLTQFAGYNGPDKWYPNWLRHRNQEVNPVWVGDLKSGEVVQYRPSRFDYEFLDTAGRRFDIAYDPQGRRRKPDRAHRPYYLQDIERIQRLWASLTGPGGGAWALSSTQIHQAVGLIEQRRVAWGLGTGLNAWDPEFRAFARQVLLNAAWRKRPTVDELEDLQDAGASGVLGDVVEIFLTVIGSREPVAAVPGAGETEEGRRRSHGL